MTTELDPLLRRLSLANTRRCWRDMVARAEKEEWSYEALLQTLFAEEVAHRRGTRLVKAVRAANFPFLRTVEEFDFTYQSTLRLTTIGSLLSPDFVTQGHAVILEGKPGRGKTHLGIAIAYRAMQNGFDALFTTAAELIEDLSVASRDGGLRDALVRYVRPHVLVVDEVGYLAYGDDAANVFFHVVNERHIKKRAMVFTTNKHPKQWGAVLHDDDLAEAIVDRILDRGRLLRLDGPSVRTRHLANDTSMNDESGQDVAKELRISGIEVPEFPERTTWRYPRLGAGPHASEDWFNHVVPALMYFRAMVEHANITVTRYALEGHGSCGSGGLGAAIAASDGIATYSPVAQDGTTYQPYTEAILSEAVLRAWIAKSAATL